MSDDIELQSRIVMCPCGGENFKIEFTNGTDGKTNSLWLKCAKCHTPRVMRLQTKELEDKSA